eukprot:SAG11_NODE_4897_length_1731_cov_1.602941_4_plen_228_part_00
MRTRERNSASPEERVSKERARSKDRSPTERSPADRKFPGSLASSRARSPRSTPRTGQSLPPPSASKRSPRPSAKKVEAMESSRLAAQQQQQQQQPPQQQHPPPQPQQKQKQKQKQQPPQPQQQPQQQPAQSKSSEKKKRSSPKGQSPDGQFLKPAPRKKENTERKDSDAELVCSVRSFMKSNKLSQVTVGQEARISQAVISQWLSLKYHGHNDKVPTHPPFMSLALF